MDFKEYTQLLTESKGNDFKAELIRLFKKDKLVTLDELEEFAKDNGKDLKQVEYTIFEFLHNLLYRKYKPFKYSHEEYEMGLEDELEHTKDKEIAKSIVLDHLRLHPNYYSQIKKAGL
jgi:hypothetical protein